MTYDASDPEQVAKAQRADDDLQKDIDFIVSAPRGRRWLYTLSFAHSHANCEELVLARRSASAASIEKAGHSRDGARRR